MQSVRRVHPIVVAAAIAALFGAGALVHHALARPLLPAVSYVRLDGSKATTEQLHGKVVLVNFWAPSCAPCVAEMPQLAELQHTLQPQGYETLAVAVRQEPPANVFRYIETQRPTLPVVIDLSGDFERSFGPIDATPTSVLIDRHGKLAARYVGRIDPKRVRRDVAGLLAEG